MKTIAPIAAASLTTEDFNCRRTIPASRFLCATSGLRTCALSVQSAPLLFVHGATYPAHSTFDLPIEGRSWMDHITARGYDVYLLDLRGYGKSTRPPEMAQIADANPPIVRTETAVKDIAAAVDFILARRNIPRLVLLGSSGHVPTRPTPSRIQTKSHGLPSMRRSGSARPAGFRTPRGPLPAYRTVTREQASARWLNGVPEHEKAALIPPGVFDAWANATWATDAEGAQQVPPVIRAPNGVMADVAATWWVGRPYYNPAKIAVPVLLVTAAWDSDVPPSMARALLPLLTNAPSKRLIELPQGTHSVMMETHRFALFDAVQKFLDEGGE